MTEAAKPKTQRCTNAACAMNGTKIKTALVECLSCGKPLVSAISLGDLGDLSDLFAPFKGFGR